MKLGIAGSGKIVNEFLSNKGDLKGLTLSAWYGAGLLKSSRSLLKNSEIERTYTDYDGMLASDILVRSVYVALWNVTSLCACEAEALEAGKDVYCWKNGCR